MTRPEKSFFEENLKEVETCVDTMENNNLSLSESVTLYKKGIELINLCKTELSGVKQQIQVYDKNTNTLIDVNPESLLGPIKKKNP